MSGKVILFSVVILQTVANLRECP